MFMFSVAYLLALLAVSITASPVEVRNRPITLPMTRRSTFSNVTDILRHDEARLAALMEYSTHGRRVNVPLLSNNFGYITSIVVGSDPITAYNLIVDSYYSVTWIKPKNMHVSSTWVDTRKPVAVTYRDGNGFFQGTMFQGTLYSNGFAVTNMPIGVASTWNGIGYEGILGIGPAVSSRGALTSSPQEMIPSITDYLYAQRTIPMPVVGISFQPTIAGIVNYGELTFGGDDPTKYIDSIEFTDITTAFSSSLHWGINQKIAYGGMEIMPLTAGVVDCDVTFLYIAYDAYEKYKAATGGVLYEATQLLRISHYQYHVLQIMYFGIGQRVYSLIPNGQIWPRSLNRFVLGGDDDIFLIVKSMPAHSGTGFGFINGVVFLQRFYTVLDSAGSRIGFALNHHTYDESN
ncbi:hypothetical protein BDR07DRAFT_1490706 [Suillus spraguei]|nr:hypothetical protein BDR07DRAFT_1490706 [Suillus spraguei]